MKHPVKSLDIVEVGGRIGIVVKMYDDGSCIVYFEQDTHSLVYTALNYRPTWRVVG